MIPLLFLCTILSFTPELAAQTLPNDEALHIIAVRVEFQPDTNRFTTGNGTFDPDNLSYLEDPGTTIDPLPHNQAYFEAHLEFAKNYFERQSRGQLTLQYQVLPDIYQLDKPMESYSPTGENPALYPLAELAKDVWEKVETTGEMQFDFQPGNNTAFVIFHAGVGRDIELTGTTLDKTPQDIPSLYMSTSTLKTLLGDTGFTGFPIDNGNLLVDNTLLLPRTLSRPGQDIAGNRFVFPLSINGMITAQIGNHIGLPDLFNTKTGESGIGRFGLMDGAGIFACNGIFPPELSAWEKIYLGWETPFTLDYLRNTPVHLPAASLREENSIAKIPISSDEYFLIENRHRDPFGNGVTLTIQTSDGLTRDITLTNNDLDCTSQNTGFEEVLPGGVVVNISNYDFALPGGIDFGPDQLQNTADDRQLNGGILIWHIDKAVIRDKLQNNRGINDDPNRRGVSLKEADGAQDIGRSTSIGINQNQANGSAFDFWWDGNNASVVTPTDTISFYQNRFGPDTTPDNQSNSGGPSFFELFEFSENIPEANFRIREVHPYAGLYELAATDSVLNVSFTPAGDEYWKGYPLSMIPLENGVLIPAQNGISFYHTNTETLQNSTVQVPSLQQPVFDPGLQLFSVAENPLLRESPMEIKFFRWEENGPEEIINYFTELNSGFLSVLENSIIDIDGTSYQIDLENREILFSGEEPAQRSERVGAYRSVIQNNSLTLFFPDGTRTFSLSIQEPFRAHTGVVQTRSDIIFYMLTDGRFSIFRPEDNYAREHVLADSESLEWPAIADFTSDGYPDFLWTDHAANQITAKNQNGAALANFPIQPPDGITFIGTPLIADINGDGKPNLLIPGQDNFSVNIFAYNGDAEPVEGFPLYVGGVSGRNNQPIHPILADNQLIALSHKGDLKVWKFPDLQNVQWSTRYGNQPNNKITARLTDISPGDLNFGLLNKEETYNWPNPAKNETFLRYQTRETAEISIVITTFSGRTLYKRDIESTGGVAEEIRIDTSGWASGGYFARVTAKAGGTTERKIVKIAIAK